MAAYPPSVRQIPDPPPVLFVDGDVVRGVAIAVAGKPIRVAVDFPEELGKLEEPNH